MAEGLIHFRGHRVYLERIRLIPLEEAILKTVARRERDGEWPSLVIDEHGLHRTKLDLETYYGMKWDFYWYGTRDILRAIHQLNELRLITPHPMGDCASLSRRGRKLLEMEEERMAKRA